MFTCVCLAATLCKVTSPSKTPVFLCRKLLREHQLEAVTKAAQQDELERRRRLEQQSKQEFPVPLLPEYTPGENKV